jgi:F-type H+-transporting ATPase subunit a
MADPVLHIKDSYYFEVPKVLWVSSRKTRQDFPDVWVSLDPQYQDWEFGRLYQELTALGVKLPPQAMAKQQWKDWQHVDHANFATPFDYYLEHKYDATVAAFGSWKESRIKFAAAEKDHAAVDAARKLTLKDYLHSPEYRDDGYTSFYELRDTRDFQSQWAAARKNAGDVKAYDADTSAPDWSSQKIQAYNNHLSGKILIPQPFGTLRNLYEKESGFAISKYLLIELFVGLILVLVFSWLAQKVRSGAAPRGYVWNLLEAFLVFIRDQIAKPVFSGHDHGHEEHSPIDAPGHADDHAKPVLGHEVVVKDAPALGHEREAHEHGMHEHGTHDHAKHAHASHAHGHVDQVQRFTPLLWTIFFFVLGCNLMGMVPWAGAPTASFGVTFALAMVTFLTVMIAGMAQFGFLGFFLNQIPGMDLPWYMAIVIKPMLFVIELLGLVIKHMVLAIRLLANMVAGHLVILGVMGLAFGAEAALNFSAPDTPGWMWYVTATIAVVGAAAFNLLELFVAFLQAYVFTFLSALFIGASIHKH